jgi:hypothetical protein
MTCAKAASNAGMGEVRTTRIAGGKTCGFEISGEGLGIGH